MLVVTQPDRPSGRGMKLKASPVKLKALELGLPVESPEKARDPEFVEKIRALDADVLVVAAYGQILSTKLLESAKRGGINLHGSILPEYRGAAPIQRAIMDGRTETGVTLMQMDKGMDTGDIIDIRTTPIESTENYADLTHKLALIAADQIKDWLPRIVAGDYPRQAQNNELATHAAKIGPDERLIDWSTSATECLNRFRALSPSPGVFCYVDGVRVKLIECLLAEISGAPQTVLAIRPLTVACANGSLILERLLPEGKKPMSGREFASLMGLNAQYSIRES